MTRDLGFMDFALFKKIIDELAEVNASFHHNRVVWLHHFGESLLHPQFDSCIHYAAVKGIRTGLSVNPMMLNEKTALSLLCSGLHILYLSLDGHNDETFFKIRGINNMYDLSRSKMIDFLKLKKESLSNMKIILSMIDFSLNDDSVAAVKEEWESNKEIDGFLLKNYTTWDGAIPEIHALAPESITAETRDYSIVNCSFPWVNMTVTWDGDVVPCCFDYNKKLVLGNALSHTLSYIWNDAPMRGLRHEFITNKVTNALCKNCEMLHSVYAPGMEIAHDVRKGDCRHTEYYL
jgi:radical SAM protein with 4Fe4S-binding SPASM domain